MSREEARPVTSGAGQEKVDETALSVAQRPVIPRRPIRDQGRGWTFYGPVGRWVA